MTSDKAISFWTGLWLVVAWGMIVAGIWIESGAPQALVAGGVSLIAWRCPGDEWRPSERVDMELPDQPARAWLLAILRAYQAQEASQ
ncbi:hypothetical protein CN97_00810 [Haematobacter massiliensis]|uniref:Uncharacterized protein n=1 Tax=Haematobacter massiliensis TaxID=195105 RepID=A0A086Y0F0_9RHOB|nr:hypothetical protein [Haematobacter massiliensis]KFI27750.1 hypothetical protein CN97_00810 [Haematobacter massiliensis]OWJ82724.1 hypothetical protein CDV51_17095 [Haematobacter massiliensis]